MGKVWGKNRKKAGKKPEKTQRKKQETPRGCIHVFMYTVRNYIFENVSGAAEISRTQARGYWAGISQRSYFIVAVPPFFYYRYAVISNAVVSCVVVSYVIVMPAFFLGLYFGFISSFIFDFILVLFLTLSPLFRRFLPVGKSLGGNSGESKGEDLGELYTCIYVYRQPIYLRTSVGGGNQSYSSERVLGGRISAELFYRCCAAVFLLSLCCY